MQMAKNAIMVVVVGLAAASSAKAAISITFDAAASNVGAGLYDFQLNETLGTPDYGSTFFLDNWPGSTPLGIVSAPTGWTTLYDTSSLAEWEWTASSGSPNGIFVVKTTPNLDVTIEAQLSSDDLGGGAVSDTVYVATVPEPAQCGFACGVMGLVFSTIWGLRRSKS
jgi:hypothetical protein